WASWTMFRPLLRQTPKKRTQRRLIALQRSTVFTLPTHRLDRPRSPLCLQSSLCVQPAGWNNRIGLN
ncbi:hypothetical protein M514_06687, partial [Trichuris suis]